MHDERGTRANERVALASVRPLAAISRAMPADVLTLRLATLDDVPMLRDLIALSAERLSVGHYTAAQVAGALEGTFGVDTQLIADGTYYVIDAPDGPAAAGGWSVRRTLYGGDQMKHGEDPLLDPAAEPARIRAFFVHPDFTRRGIGSTILRACMDAARAAGFRRVTLASTLPGVPFYRALGFAEHERFDIPLPDGLTLPVIRMERDVGFPLPEGEGKG
jgi:GNAT superfamily N-acetyltransferase